MTLVSTQPLTESASYDFYRDALRLLLDGEIPFLVGGAFAFKQLTGIERITKDFDIFVRPGDMARVVECVRAGGYEGEITFPHWLGKIRSPAGFIDVIFNSGNGLAAVDDDWFAHAEQGEVLGLALAICPAEEAIWSKAFVMERERYDGADVNHILLARAETLDWDRLLRRFGDHWRVLLSSLVLFGFVFPSERRRIPMRVMDELLGRLGDELEAPPRSPLRLCNGTLLSWSQYLVDLDRRRLIDARLQPHGSMAPEQIAAWTAADKG
jgi:hypothetical protein